MLLRTHLLPETDASVRKPFQAEACREKARLTEGQPADLTASRRDHQNCPPAHDTGS